MTEQYLTLAEVRDLLTAEAEIRGQESLLASQKHALEHAQAVCRNPSGENAKELVEEVKQIDVVSDSIACKIADILPKYPEDVRAIFSKERITLEPAQIQAILEIVAKYI